ncbi:PREDICTED: Meckel syndrome type 1 protein [Ceratosolen solmsi marchali]|uniref:Meckel syndrome type 1 protein n=1 Tax=Ceratosolen solmsi marchali TaxID=326594 RepID=A0AAJ6YPM6_9HYME|nr:PREDICTED: Meckel syndrome type 1 protein [Ceratosolen solmsi marchali]
MLEPAKSKAKISSKYNVKQPIENFKVRVKIIQQKSPLAELFENERETRDGNFLEAEEYEFSWQEKVLGPYEVKYYRDVLNCTTDKQKEYRRRILNTVDSEKGSRLYSYVLGDSYYPDSSLITGRFRSRLSQRNERATPPVKNRKPFVKRYNQRVVDEAPSNAKINENHYLYKEHESMYIVVDLSPKDETTVESTDSEVLLCAIIYDPQHKCLTLSPDFSEDEPYNVEGIGMNYDYWISDASPKPTNREMLRHLENVKKEVQRMRALKGAQLFHELEVPGPRVLRLFVNLDIGLARDFEHDDALFVSYRVELPRHWRSCGHLAGRTQRCRAQKGRTHFGYCTEVILEFDLTTEREFAVSRPRIIFSVASLDYWTRYRIEGYGAVPLSPSSGLQELELQTWRPACGFVDALRRFFTGGSRELEDPGYCGLPSCQEGPRLDKHILGVVPSGRLQLRISITRQSLDDTALEVRNVDLLEGVDEVLTRFKEARERMIQARAMCI